MKRTLTFLLFSIWVFASQAGNSANQITAPNLFSAVALSASAIELKWEASVPKGNDKVMTYRIYRNGAQISSVPATQITFRNTDLAASTTYQYRVDAEFSRGSISASQSVSATTLASLAAVNPSGGIAFGTVCAGNSTCNYAGAKENSLVSAKCESGAMTVKSSSYGANGSNISCLTYAAAACNGKSSCSLTFTNTNCGKDPIYGVVKTGSMTVACAPIVESPPASCLFNGQTIASGNPVTAYQSSSVPSGQSCVSEIRTCNNGVLSGSYSFASCSVEQLPAPPPEPTPVPSATYPVYQGCEAPATSYARTIYIDPVNGTDTGTGSSASPLRLISASWAKLSPGDHVILLPGDHGSINVSRYNLSRFATATQWTWFDAREGAIVRNWEIRDMRRWLLTNFEYTVPTGRLINMYDSFEIVIADSDFYTQKDISALTNAELVANLAGGVGMRNGKCFSFLRNRMFNLGTGITVYMDKPLKSLNMNDKHASALIHGNYLHHIVRDGIRPVGSSITISNNKITDIMVSGVNGDGNHDDGIQSFNIGGIPGNENISILNNFIQERTGPNPQSPNNIQGIFLADGTYPNVVVRGNTVIAGGWHGITVGVAVNGLIENNTVINISPTLGLWIRIDMPQNTVVRNNIASSYSRITYPVEANNLFSRDPVGDFLQFDLVNNVYDLHLRSTSVLYGKGAGAP